MTPASIENLLSYNESPLKENHDLPPKKKKKKKRKSSRSHARDEEIANNDQIL